MIDLAVELISQVYPDAIAIAFVFEISNIIVATFLRVAFGGKLWFGR